MDYLPIVGIEVHAELKTKSKMFCGCSAQHFRVKPNTHTCPVCLGLPGALPVPNKKAIEWCLLIGRALNCRIAEVSKFDRKNYFYPDLPKGYQISQYDQPFCRSGKINIKNQISKIKITDQNEKIIRINRVHMEEDTGKLVHQLVDGEKVSLIDFNRSGVPLVEIVTEPDIHSSEEAVEYLKKIQQIIRYLNVSDCDMEKGSMRCEVNVSLKRFTSEESLRATSEVRRLPGYKVEVKNINSFKFVKSTIEYEIKRQAQILEEGKAPIQETRGFSEARQKTFSQRSKEEAHDYRYFPEPDIPEFRIMNSELRIKKMPEMPEQKMERFIKKYGLSEVNAQILVANKKVAQYFEEAIGQIGDIRLIRQIANVIVNKKVDVNKFSPSQLVIHLQKQKQQKVSDQSQLAEIVVKVLKENKKAGKDYKKGKMEALGFLIGKVMKETSGKADAMIVRKLLMEKLT